MKEKLLLTLRDEQGKGSHGKTMTKEMLLQILVATLLPMIETALAWAIIEKNQEMIDLFTVVEDDFYRGFNEAVVLADNTIKGLEDNAEALAEYDITPIMITAANNAKIAFIAAKETPKQKIGEKKVATASITTEIKATDKILTICDLLISGKYKTSDPDMVSEYKVDRRIGDSVGRHTTITGHIFSDEEHFHPISGVNMSIESLHRTEVSNVDGEAEIVQFKKGDYSLLFKHHCFGDLVVPFSIKNGKHEEINVVMIANKLYGRATKNGIGLAGYFVSIVGTNLSAVTDANGYFVILEVPEGNGVLECSNDAGDLISTAYVMGNGGEVKVDFVF